LLGRPWAWSASFMALAAAASRVSAARPIRPHGSKREIRMGGGSVRAPCPALPFRLARVVAQRHQNPNVVVA
jgi:hypothetical protein